MHYCNRLAAYEIQNGDRVGLTARQKRRLRHKSNRWELEAVQARESRSDARQKAAAQRAAIRNGRLSRA